MTGTTANTRSYDQREAALVYIARRLAVRPSITQTELADELAAGGVPNHPRVSRQQISLDIAKVRQRWIESQKDSHDVYRGRDLAILDRVLEEAWAAWFRSLEDHRTETVQEHTTTAPPLNISDAADGSVKAVVAQALREQARVAKDSRRSGLKVEKRDGRPEFLAVIHRCLERRAAILGYDAPERVDLTLYVRERAAALGLDPDEAERRLRPALLAVG